MPFESKFRLSALSVEIIDTKRQTSCTVQNMRLTVSATSVSTRDNNRNKTNVTSRRTVPTMSHTFPQYLCANSHVSLFFIDIVVLYPNKWFIFFGALFVKYNPKANIVTGIKRSQISIDIKMPIQITLYQWGKAKMLSLALLCYKFLLSIIFPPILLPHLCPA